LQEATRRQFLLQQDIKNITLFTCRLASSPMLLAEHTGMHYFPSPSFLSPKVSVLYFFIYSFIYSEHPPITASKQQRKTPLYQKFCRQLYHACLYKVFEPLKAGMTTPEVVKCPDGHFRRAIYGLGPYIADYPEQVWLSGVVQGWCPKYVSFVFGIFIEKLIRFKMPCETRFP
jgi:hypothetical protein